MFSLRAVFAWVCAVAALVSAVFAVVLAVFAVVTAVFAFVFAVFAVVVAEFAVDCAVPTLVVNVARSATKLTTADSGMLVRLAPLPTNDPVIGFPPVDVIPAAEMLPSTRNTSAPMNDGEAVAPTYT